MKIWAVFRKCLREQLRELWLLGLIVSLTPFFVFLMYAVYGGGTFAYKVVVVNQDQAVVRNDGSTYRGGDDLLQTMVTAKNAAGSPALCVISASEHAVAEELLLRGKAHALIEIPAGFSRAILAARETPSQPPTPSAALAPAQAPAEIVYMGDLTNPSYLVAAVLAVTKISTYIEDATGKKGPVALTEKPLGGSGARSELDIVLPGMFVVAIIMLLFPVAMSLARESDSGCLRRLQLTRMTAFELLTGLSLVQILVGLFAVAMAFAAALAIGFKSQGSLLAAVGICVIASFATIGVGLLVACFSRSVTEAFLIGNFPMMLLMFFSGSMIPIPQVPIASFGDVTIGLFDWLPTRHAVSAMNKILGLGLGVRAVAYELVCLVLLSGLYFAAGVWLFRRRRMAPA